MNKWQDEHLYNFYGKYNNLVSKEKTMILRIMDLADTSLTKLWLVSFPLFVLFILTVPLTMALLAIPMATLHTIDWFVDGINTIANKTLHLTQTRLSTTLKMFMLTVVLCIMFTWGFPYMVGLVKTKTLDVVDDTKYTATKPKDFKPIKKEFKHKMI